MIKIDLTLAVSLFLSLSLIVVFVKWISYTFNNYQLTTNGIRHLKQCPFCTYIFFQYKDSELLVCPRCKCYFNVDELDKTIEAKNAFEQAIPIFKRQRSEAEPESISAFIGLITCYLQLSDFEQGEKLAEYAADLSRGLLGPADSNTVMVMNLWAVCAEARGKDKKAAEIRARIDSPDAVSSKPKRHLRAVD